MQPNVTPPPLISNNNRNETLALVHGIYAGLLSFSAVVFLYLEYQQRSIAVSCQPVVRLKFQNDA